MPLGQIDLPITFRDQLNYRIETLTFEVVGFPRTFHAILGHPCYAKFMAVPNYTYLKLKMSGPRGVITVAAPSSVLISAKSNAAATPPLSSPLGN